MRVHFLFLLIILLCLPVQSFAQSQSSSFLEEGAGKAVPDPLAEQRQREKRTQGLLDKFSDGVVEGMKESGKDAQSYLSDDGYLQIPTAFIDEAMDYKAACEADIERTNYYNCECLAVKFLDLRVEHGADYSVQSINLDLQDQCKDGTFLAGLSYNRCLGQVMRPARGQSLDKFCQCYGRVYARSYETYRGVVSSRGHLALRTNALLKCRERGSELAPD